ncbi:hypothetical protein SDC9_113509 [bioreactor metagenome]|uniref:ABC3 transporter permease protein domain-containing protein n=1 Tax=bioreactor metagenome TaxID=1076179 RepID=A0A645BM97_9ZZZZ
MLLISFFSFFGLQTNAITNQTYMDLPSRNFTEKVQLCMNLTVAFLVVITFITVRIYCRMQSEEINQTLAVLTSVGATGKQKRILILIEICALYLLPNIIGVICGSIPGIALGRRFQEVSQENALDYGLFLLLSIILIAGGMLLIIISYFLQTISLKRHSVIHSIRKQNIKASKEKHSYHQSQTFKNQPILKLLANKSMEYYKKAYNGIALTFATSALYPVLAFLLLWNIGNSNVVLDTNPYDQINTTADVLAVVHHLLLFLIGCFLVLTLAGIAQTVFIARMQYMNRKKSANIYLSIGMPDTDIKKMLIYELRSVFLRFFVYLFFGAFLINTCFKMFVK